MRLLLVAVVLGTPACLTEPDNDVIQWSDDFEACADLCDWTVTGDVRRVTTYHPGEHALRLGAGAGAGHRLQIRRDAVDPNQGWQDSSYSDGNWLELSTDCLGPGSLELRADGADQFVIEVGVDDRGLGRFTRHRVNFPPIDPTRPVVFTGLELTGGALACQIDNLQVRISGGTYGY